MADDGGYKEQTWVGGKAVKTKIVRSIPKTPKPKIVFGKKRKGSH
jgi:hypothetical protein